MSSQEFYTCKKCKEINAVANEQKVSNQKIEKHTMYCPNVVWDMLKIFAIKHKVSLGKALLLLLTKVDEAESKEEVVNVGGLRE